MVEAKIRGAQDSPAITQNYKTIVLKPHVVDGVNVISQQDVAGNNKKFVIKWGFTLTENLVFGVGCILDFDGGFFTNDEAHNYTITGNNTRVILNTDEAACLKGVYKGGTWIYPEFPLSTGSTSDRPSLSDSNIGYQFFDITLSKPIWFVGNSTWVDATGATV